MIKKTTLMLVLCCSVITTGCAGQIKVSGGVAVEEPAAPPKGLIKESQVVDDLENLRSALAQCNANFVVK